MSATRRRLVERAFHLLYHELAWSYDAVSWAVSLGHWKAWTMAALPFLPGPRVLELGHGPGHVLAALATRGDSPIGLDLSPQMGRMAARRWPGHRPPLVRGRAQALPFAAGTFDGALATFPTSYILAPETLAAVYGVLRPGGCLVVVPEARLLGRGSLVRFIEWLYEVTGQQSAPTVANNAWTRRFAGTGFAVAVHHVVLSASVVTVVVATRPADS